jgi:hypothetical protein
MWIAGLGIKAYELTSGLDGDEIPRSVNTDPPEPVAWAGLLAMGVVISGAIVLVVILLSRITGGW